jgi:hypothetical protein
VYLVDNSEFNTLVVLAKKAKEWRDDTIAQGQLEIGEFGAPDFLC